MIDAFLDQPLLVARTDNLFKDIELETKILGY